MINIQEKHSKLTINKQLFILVFVSVFSIIAPFYIGIFSLALYIVTKRDEWIYVFFISFILLFSNMNLYKEVWAFGDYLGIGNDLGWYSTQWFSFADHPYGFMSIFDEDYLIFINDGFLVRPKISEPIYHAYSYFFSRLKDGNYIFFVYSLTFFIYLPACIVIYKILESNKLNPILIALVLIFFIFFSMKFTNMFNMIRHYCSGSFLIITLYFIYFDRIKWAFLFGILASLTHNAAVVVCAVYAIVYFVDQAPIKSDLKKIRLVIIGTSLLSIAYLFVYYLTYTNYEELNDRGSGLIFKLLDLFIIGLSVIAYINTQKSSINKLWLYYLGVITLITFMHFTSFLQLRYYAYFDYFRWIGVLYIFNFLLKVTKFNLVFLIIMLGGFVSFLWLRISISDFDFDGMFHDYFLLRYA
jgi:hypothetical protein